MAWQDQLRAINQQYYDSVDEADRRSEDEWIDGTSAGRETRVQPEYAEWMAVRDIKALLAENGITDSEGLKTAVSGSHNDSYINLGIGNHLYNDKSSGFNPPGGGSRDVDFGGGTRDNIGESSLVEAGKDPSVFSSSIFALAAAGLAPFTGGLSVAALAALKSLDGETLHQDDYAKVVATVIGANGGEWLEGATGLSPEWSEALSELGADVVGSGGDIEDALKKQLLKQGIDWSKDQIGDYVGSIMDPEGHQNDLVDKELGTPGFSDEPDYFDDENYWRPPDLNTGTPSIGDTPVGEGDDWHWERDPDSVSGWKVVPNTPEYDAAQGGGGSGGGSGGELRPPNTIGQGKETEAWRHQNPDGSWVAGDDTGDVWEIDGPPEREDSIFDNPFGNPLEDNPFQGVENPFEGPPDPAEPSEGTGGGTGGGEGTGEGEGEGTGEAPITTSIMSGEAQNDPTALDLFKMPWLKRMGPAGGLMNNIQQGLPALGNVYQGKL